MPVQMILQIKDARESGAGGQILIPAAFAALVFDQILDALVEAAAGGVASRDQAQDRPGSLRGRAVIRCESIVVVAGAALAPAAVGVLNRPQPFARAENISLAITFAGGLRTPQREIRAVDVVDAPAP